MNPNRIKELLAFHRDGLLQDTIPWWQSRFIDEACGGFLTYRDADGSLLSTDKPVWVLGRITWMFSRLYNHVEAKPEWLDIAHHGVDFMLKHAFDTDGRMYYSLTREGRPLRKRRYLFSEAFGAIALAEYAQAIRSSDPARSEEMRQRAREVFDTILKFYTTPGLLEPKVLPQTRRLKGHAMPMILVATSQVLRQYDPQQIYDEVITNSIDEIFRDFVKPEKKCLLETVQHDGSILDTPEGRTVNPGHAIESSWFIMEEGHRRNDHGLIDRACQILEWSLESGWDPKYGGILYFVDCDGRQAEPYEHDMKLWWPHNEALYACLLAFHLTGDEKWSAWYERLHEWSYRHFPDREHGEWFGYLHRDGSISSTVKGNMWKGPFHLPRYQLYSWKLLEEMAAKFSA